MMDEKTKDGLLFLCAAIESCGRYTRNRRADIVRAVGKKKLTHILELADVYHCDPIENLVGDLIEKCGIADGKFDNVSTCKYDVPSVIDIAEVYRDLILDVSENSGAEPIDALASVYTSWISDKISDYECSMFYESPEYLYLSYLDGEPISD
jgi:hypothetical protein